MKYAKHLKNTPQSQPIPGKQMIQNAAGGYTFEVSGLERLRRFLILGSEGGTYYAGEHELTLENAQNVVDCVKNNGLATVELIAGISDRGLAPKNDAAVFALAIASVHGDGPTRKSAFARLPVVCRTSTHLFQFCEAREALGGGWGRGMREAVAKWYEDRTPMSLVRQAIKYQQRNGWSHRDLLRLSHPKPAMPGVANIFNAICREDYWRDVAQTNVLVSGWLRLRDTTNVKEAAQIIESAELDREMVPSELLTKPEVWNAMLPRMGLTALMRNLGNMTRIGLLTPLGDATRKVVERLTSAEQIRNARIHPFSVLLALKTYDSGRGFRGTNSWDAVPQITNALERMFELAFANVEMTGKRFMLALDVSGSMSSKIADTNISACEAAAAMALITARVEPQNWIFGFADSFRELGITPADSLSTATAKTQRMNFGGTDCALPIAHARKHKIPVDVFVVYTDNETWRGPVHACQELVAYRREMNIPAKLIMVAFTATKNSVADPSDPGSLNIVGLDASLPSLIQEFVI